MKPFLYVFENAEKQKRKVLYFPHLDSKSTKDVYGPFIYDDQLQTFKLFKENDYADSVKIDVLIIAMLKA